MPSVILQEGRCCRVRPTHTVPQHENVDGTYQRPHTQKSPFDSLSAISSSFLLVSPSRHVQSRGKSNRPRSTNCVHRARNLSLYRTGYKKDFFASLPSINCISTYVTPPATIYEYNTRYLLQIQHNHHYTTRLLLCGAAAYCYWWLRLPDCRPSAGRPRFNGSA